MVGAARWLATHPLGRTSQLSRNQEQSSFPRWVGALKITAGSAGTAAAGALIGTGLHLPTVLAATAAAAAIVVTKTAPPGTTDEVRLEQADV